MAHYEPPHLDLRCLQIKLDMFFDAVSITAYSTIYGVSTLQLLLYGLKRIDHSVAIISGKVEQFIVTYLSVQ